LSAELLHVQIWLATCYLALYGAYVTIVFKGPRGGAAKGDDAISRGSSQDGLEVGGVGSSSRLEGDEHAVHARWM